MSLEKIIFRRLKVRKWRDLSVLGNSRCLKKNSLDKIVYWVELHLNFPRVLYYEHAQMTGVSWRDTSLESKGMCVLFLQFACFKKCSSVFGVAFQILKNVEIFSI